MLYLKQLIQSLFGEKYEPVWRQFADANKGNYVIGKGPHFDSIEINYRDYLIVFDRYILYQVVGGGSYETHYIRIRMEFKSNDELRFRLTKQYLVDTIGKIFGLQDIQIGDKSFDRRFLIKGNDELKVQMFFSNETIKELILAENDIHLQLLDKEGVFDEPIREGNSMLYYLSETQIKEIGQLNALLKLYCTAVDQLTKLGSAKPISNQMTSL